MARGYLVFSGPEYPLTSAEMDALRKQASKFREQVAKQQQVASPFTSFVCIQWKCRCYSLSGI